MSKGLENFLPFIIPANSDYPWGDIKDDTGSGDGTNVDRVNHADYHQTFRKLLSLASIVPNGLPDNVTNGYQYIQAMNRVYKRANGVKIITSNTAIVAADYNKLIFVDNATPGNITVNLPNSALVQDGHSVLVYNNGNYRIDVSFSVSDFVMGGTEITLVEQGDFCEMILDKPNQNWVFANAKITPLRPTYQLLTLGAGWAAPSAGYEPMVKLENGRYSFKGIASKSTGTGTIFTIAPPTIQRDIGLITGNNTGLIANFLRVIAGTGNVSLQDQSGTTVNVYLDGVSFDF